MPQEDNLRTAFEICGSTFLASLVAYVLDVVPAYSLPIAIVLGIATMVTSIIWKSHSRLSRFFWKKTIIGTLRNRLIGIINEDSCPRMFTDFSPQDWQRRLQQLNLETRLIKMTEICNSFACVINPYGETYPEEDLFNLESLKKVKDYVNNGGIFVHAGGIAFFYGYDYRNKRNPPLAKDIQILVPTRTPTGVTIMVPQPTYPPAFSLIDTVLNEHFHVVTTWGGTEKNPVFQQPDDRRFVGDIANAGGVAEVLQFRAVREPMRRCIPFLRANSSIGEVYPIAGIPFGKGCLVLCGMNLLRQPNNPDWNPTIHSADFEKICVVISNLLESRGKGIIPLDAHEW